jgi:hypothetical protein
MCIPDDSLFCRSFSFTLSDTMESTVTLLLTRMVSEGGYRPPDDDEDGGD